MLQWWAIIHVLNAFYRCQTNNRLIKTYLNWCALPYHILHPLTTCEWKLTFFGLTALWSFVPAWLMACHSSPRLSIRMVDYNGVSRQERLAYPVASFLLHIDNNITTQLYNQQHIDLRAASPSAHLSATDHGSPSLVSSETTRTVTYLFSLEEMI